MLAPCPCSSPANLYELVLCRSVLSAPAQAGQAERLSEVTQSERSSRCATRFAGCVTNSRLLLQSKPSARMCSQSSRATELSVGPFTARDAGCSVNHGPCPGAAGLGSPNARVSYSTLASKGKIWSSQSVKAQAAPGVSRKRRRRYCSTPPRFGQGFCKLGFEVADGGFLAITVH